MELSSKSGQQKLAMAMPGRPLRTYPALLSTEAEATAWARAGTQSGSLVIADYQISPRGRSGLPWKVQLGEGLGFSLVLRPSLVPEREGWPYVVASIAISDALGSHSTMLRWPDQIERTGGPHLAALGITTQLGSSRTDWVVVTALIESVPTAPHSLLAAVVEAIERRTLQHPAEVLDDYRSRCATLGEHVLARMIPLGPAGPQITGTAVDVLDDGALVLLTSKKHRVAVRPQNLGVLEPAPAEPTD